MPVVTIEAPFRYPIWETKKSQEKPLPDYPVSLWLFVDDPSLMLLHQPAR